MSWSARQKAVLGMYRRYSGMSDEEYREILYVETGQRSSTAPTLLQGHYDRVMPRFETRAYLAHVNGRGVGPVPSAIRDWWYWRQRAPRDHGITTRQHRMILALWHDLQALVGEAQRTDAYLAGIIEQAIGRHVALDQMAYSQAGDTIEALKDYVRRMARERKDQEVRQAADGTAGAYPFARFQVSEEARKFWAEKGGEAMG